MIRNGVMGNDPTRRARKFSSRMARCAVGRRTRTILLNAHSQVVINEIIRDGVGIAVHIHPMGLIADSRSNFSLSPRLTSGKVAVMTDDISIKQIVVSSDSKNTLIDIVMNPISPDDGVVHAVKFDSVVSVFNLESLNGDVAHRHILA